MNRITAFYSDPHFGHAKLIKNGDRPFIDVEEMDATLVRNYNNCIGPDGVVLWMGDCFLTHTTERCYNILMEMSGVKILMPGNHDGTVTSMLKLGFDMVVKQPVLRISNTICKVSHYPRFEVELGKPVVDKFQSKRADVRPGEILLHGHTHSTTKIRDNQINISVEAWDYKPAMYQQVYTLVRSYENAHR